MRFIEYDITSDIICMGERVRAGIFRPCARTIRYSQISGALRKRFADPNIHAVGHLVDGEGKNILDDFIYSPRDKTSGISKVPLTVEVLTEMTGKVYVIENDVASGLPDSFEVSMGALLSKGLGRCRLTKARSVETGKPAPGILKVRIPVSKMALFGIVRVIDDQPVYGYLFEPTSETSGHYVRALFEGSNVVAPACLLRKEVE